MKKRRRQPNHDRVPVYMASDSLRVLCGLQAWKGVPVTRLPIDSRLSVDRPDLPEYELNQACPVTGELSGLEAHHIWRRSAGYSSWWVELPTGEIVGNRINLSSEAHYRVTVNKARIAYTDGIFDWVENDEWTPLRWQPPVWKGEAVFPSDDDAWIYQPYTRIDVSGMVVPLVENAADNSDELPRLSHLEPGHDCPTCKRRVPIPKKKSSPTDTKPMTFGRAPADAADELKDRVNDLAVSSGLSTAPYPQVRAIMLALLLAESVHPDLLQEVASDMTWGKKKDG